MAKNHYRATVNNLYAFEFTTDDIMKLDWIKTGTTAYHLIVNDQSYHIDFEVSDVDDRRYMVQMNGQRHPILIEDPLDLLIGELGFELDVATTVSEIEAPMPGLILELSVTEGQQVSEGDMLLILEAMKMENVITSPREGTIKSIAVSQGDTVDKKQVLITFE